MENDRRRCPGRAGLAGLALAPVVFLHTAGPLLGSHVTTPAQVTRSEGAPADLDAVLARAQALLPELAADPAASSQALDDLTPALRGSSSATPERRAAVTELLERIAWAFLTTEGVRSRYAKAGKAWIL